ncbi:MAG: M23 family metallopeptidase [Ruminococcaceae bacterium]|nr:M23 family metallopeptidase [Oscillospiraceae bacterium]
MANKVKKVSVKVLAIIICMVTVCSMFTISFSAASWPSISSGKPIKVYTISTGNNTTAYTSTSLSSKKGTIYASDEVHIYQIGKNSNGKYYAYCSYPISSGRKNAYIPLSVVTKATAPASPITAKTTATTYRRASTSLKAGSISKGDKVYKLAVSGSYTQVLYNIGSASNPSGWRMAWVTTSQYNNLKGSTTTTTKQTSSAWDYPMKNAYCTWRSYSNMSWASYTNNSSARDYHLGIDIWGTNGYVYAAADGKIVASSKSPNGANGRFIIIQHTLNGKTVYSFYAHLASLNVTSGKVSRGQKIAVAGGSGYGKDNYYGKHLHFAIVNKLNSNGSYYGYSTYFTGNSTTYSGTTFYNPVYVIKYDRLP